jgi:protein involved in polysaccharide export with SLBB domain
VQLGASSTPEAIKQTGGRVPGILPSGEPCVVDTTTGQGEGSIQEAQTAGAKVAPTTGGQRATCIPLTTAASASGQQMAGAQGSAAIAAADADAGGYKTSEGGFFGKALGDYRVSVSGAVQDPGMYMVLPGTAVSELIVAAGGLTNDVDLSNFELTSTVINNQSGVAVTERNLYPASSEELQRITLRSYDDIQFRRVYSDMNGGFVTIKGEVRNPGTYSIRRGEQLSSVLRRAGGMTDHAYPYGAVFTRASVAVLEQSGNARVASEIRSQLLDAVMRPNSSTQSSSGLTADTLGAIQAMIAQLQSQPAVGRVSISADPTVLAQHPERDVILEGGDTLVVPQRPSTVTVLGEVMQPGTFIFDDSLSTSDYVERAGGYTAFADSSRVIVVLPDGRAQLPEKSWISLSRDADIAPGTTIVVSRDVSSLTTHQMIVDFTQIFSQLATSAAALAVLSTVK